MKAKKLHTKGLPTALTAFAIATSVAMAQDAAPVPGADAQPATEDPAAPAPPADEQPAPPAPPAPAAGEDVALPGEEQAAAGQPVVNANNLEDGLRVQDANLNDIMELLATQAGLSYFHNNRISGDDFKVNGYLRNGDPLQQMNDLAFQFGLTLYRKGDTAYALTPDQLNQLPANEWHYSLRYLRPKDIEQIKALISPLLSPSTGIVNFEPKTNTIIVIDTPNRIERVQNLLQRVDRAKGQIVIEVKIYRVNSGAAQALGVDWSKSLGRSANDQEVLEIVPGINSLLGLPSFGSTVAEDIVLAPDQLRGIFRALNEGGITKLQNNPVLITEDNEPASISVIDRIPIITTTTNNTSAGSSETEEVRYKIDESDSTDPETTREIGTTIFLTPTVLPDGTIRLNMRPRTASVTRYIDSPSGNSYPEVRESTVSTIARIPDGHSLIVGGFFQESEITDKNKVPLLGDVPVLNFFFKNKTTSKETSSLIFVVTPSTYDPANHDSHHKTHSRVSSTLELPCDHESISKEHPGVYHEPNLKRTLHNIGHETQLNTHGSGSSSSSTYNSSQSDNSRRFRLRR
ncbi:type II/III secretion system short domain-containing protein [Rubritalea squalenifaciens DSM 18772]|uniref:Type II/III secretion system short domain-containing protein n=1 Tax=Rubritalea squalenifaciens DSM 18772 TaxID=1123071 RepID=A0A1M6RKD4_9BACT|nr:secretin N-terminal domain-containing protein [Rubritalea squalenifaciens]SHK32828.1 type II/III secretion system short domain-containing protein [Rubritalea squalenifaciens DSM 18772]